MRLTRDMLMRTLKNHPEGLKSSAVGALLNADKKRVSEKLGRLCAYGIIARDDLPRHVDGRRKEYTYFLKKA